MAFFVQSVDLAAPPAADGATANIWMPEAPPASLHAMDDYFEAGSLDAKWLDYDHGAFVTHSISAARQSLLLTAGTVPGGSALSGKYQPVPGSEFVAYAKVFAIGVAMGGNPFAISPGLLLLEDGADPNGNVWHTYCRRTNGAAGGAAMLNTSAALGGVLSAVDLTQLGWPSFVRVRVKATEVWGGFSIDGKSWHDSTAQTVGFTPSHIGPGANFTAGDGGIAGFEFFKVFEGAGTSDPDATQLGRIVGVS